MCGCMRQSYVMALIQVVMSNSGDSSVESSL
jgi:hypothetical protein